LISGLLATTYIHWAIVAQEPARNAASVSWQGKRVGEDVGNGVHGQFLRQHPMLPRFVSITGVVGSLLFSLVVELLFRARRIARIKNEAANRARIAQQGEEKTRNELEAILGSSGSVAIIAMDLNGVVTLFNPGAERMLGYKAADVVDQQTPLLWHIDEEIRARCLELEKEGWPTLRGIEGLLRPVVESDMEEREWTFVRKDETRFPAQLRTTVVHDGNLQPTGYLAIATDISQQKKYEAALQQVNAETTIVNRYLLAIHDVQNTLFTCQTEGEVAHTIAEVLTNQFGVYCAKVWLRRPGDLCSDCAMTDRCDGQGKCLHLITSSGHSPDTDADFRRVPLGTYTIGCIAEGGVATICNDAVDDVRVPDREWAASQDIRSFAGLPLVADGKSIGVIAIYSRNPMPRYLLEMLEILAKLTTAAIRNAWQISELQRARDAANAANVSKSAFLANMSHEIRTPMTAILGFTETIADNVTDPENVEAIETVRRNGEHLLEIINDILDLSKVESGKLSVETIKHNPGAIVAEVASLVKGKVENAGISFDVEYVGEIPETIQSDPTRLRQILINVVGNSIKFTKVGGVRLIARLVTSEEQPLMQFDVLDTGLGMTLDQSAKLFQPFAQADLSTTRNFGGTGLGLTISKQLSRMLGGDIVLVKSEPGVGTHFRITIATGPLDDVPLALRPTTMVPEDVTAPTKDQLQQSLVGYRILLAEDGPDNQRLIAFVLRKAGADVAVATDGKCAMENALAARDEGNPYDAILMDMQMPVMDGYEATRALRQNDYRGPIIALTAHAMAGDRQKCLDAGCDDYQMKPINRRNLIAGILDQLCSKAKIAATTD